MEIFLALAPYLLILLCPAAMFFGMRFMMKGMHGHQSSINMAPPHNEMSNGEAEAESVDAPTRPFDKAQARHG